MMSDRLLSTLSRSARLVIYFVGGTVALVAGVFFAVAASDAGNQNCAQFGWRHGNCPDALSVMKLAGGIIVASLLVLGSIFVLGRRAAS